MTNYYMGISALHHDSAAALIDENGNIICVSQEERRTGIKNDKSWPQKSIGWCIRQAQSRGHEIDDKNLKYGYYEKPGLKFLRRTVYNPKDISKHWNQAAIPEQKLHDYVATSHHMSHAIAACATAPFDTGVYMIVDAIGEWNTVTWGTYVRNGSGVVQKGKINYPHSLGILYSAFTRWLGLKPNEDEYIVMGASAYGKPVYYQQIMDEFIEFTKPSDIGFRLKKNIHHGVEQYLGDEVPIEDWYDWCASIQAVFEHFMTNMVQWLNVKYGPNMNLILGGGCALNCVANTKIMETINPKNIWILPSPGDSGNALGAAAYAAGLDKLNWEGPFLGDTIETNEPSIEVLRDVVSRLERGKMVGWIQGREEFGPRAFGHRSLLADPRRPRTKELVNKIKDRQEFRPFAPAVLEEEAYRYFRMVGKPENHRYMQFVSDVRNPKSLPGICHIDNTARVQTVPVSDDPFRKLLEQWERATDCCVLLNTSLNVKGQPLISSRAEAIKMLLNTPMDALVIGDKLYQKVEHPGLDDDTNIIAEPVDYQSNNSSF